MNTPRALFLQSLPWFVLAVALGGLFQYAIGRKAAYDFGGFAGMAVPTAICFAALAIRVIMKDKEE
jgi:hypothetical protein